MSATTSFRPKTNRSKRTRDLEIWCLRETSIGKKTIMSTPFHVRYQMLRWSIRRFEIKSKILCRVRFDWSMKTPNTIIVIQFDNDSIKIGTTPKSIGLFLLWWKVLPHPETFCPDNKTGLEMEHQNLKNPNISIWATMMECSSKRTFGFSCQPNNDGLPLAPEDRNIVIIPEFDFVRLMNNTVENQIWNYYFKLNSLQNIDMMMLAVRLLIKHLSDQNDLI